MTALLKVMAIATAMAIVGTLIPFGVRERNWHWLPGFAPKVILASNIFWLSAALMFRRKPVPLKWALELGAASPFLGAVLLGLLFPRALLGSYPGQPPESLAATLVKGIMVYLAGVASWFWIFMPVGMVTAYLVYKTQRRKARPA